MNRNPRRGIHLPNTNGTRIVQPWEYEALGRIWPGAVSLLHFQLDQDPALVRWLRRRSQDDMLVFVRYWHPFGEVPSTVAVTDTIARLAIDHPYVSGWIPANEQNIEGWSSWAHIDSWNTDVWYRIQWHAGSLGRPIPLAYPPFAQDAYPMPHHEGYDTCRSSIELYHSWFTWHDYWAPGSPRMIEDDFPQWLRDYFAENQIRRLVHECGRLPAHQGQYDGLIDELVDRFGSINNGTQGRSSADAVTPWLLGDESGQFDGYAYVDREGGIRQICLDWAEWGP